MKICIINDDLKIGGKEKVIITKANEFVKNHDVSIILLGSDNSLEDNLDKRINVVYLNMKLDYSLSFPKLFSLFFPFPKKAAFHKAAFFGFNSLVLIFLVLNVIGFKFD